MVLARVVIHVLARVLPHMLARVLLHVLARVIIHVHDYYSKTCRQGAPVNHKLSLFALGLGFRWLQQRLRLSEVGPREKDKPPQGIGSHSDIFHHIFSGKAAVTPISYNISIYKKK